MTAALTPLRNNVYSTPHAAIYPGLDFQDIRYPTLAQSKSPHRAHALVLGSNDRSDWESINDNSTPKRNNGTMGMRGAVQPAWAPEQRGQQYQGTQAAASPETQSLASQQSQSQEPQRSMLSYALPPGTTRRVLERYSLDENEQRAPSRSSAHTKLQDDTNPMISAFRQAPSASTTPRHTSVNPVNAGPSNTFSMPLSASPSYNPPVAPNPRAHAQQPTYITPPTTPTPIKTVYSPPPPQEEICVECAMRDQDMADVDVTSPGAWDRESDVAFEDLKRREREDEKNGVVHPDGSTRPRAKGGRLTEQNLKVWLSINPREPTSRQQTLRAYITSQRALLEAEALAHARAQQEARQLDNKMRDTYSQLRRSAYDVGSNGVSPADETSGLRIKPPRSPSSPYDAHSRSQSREITLLENGLIVEHVNVRKEEKEAKDRKRKDERRVRKSSRSSNLDVGSIISANSYGPLTDSGVGGLNTYPRYSQASYSDVHSLGSASPRRTRFFGVRNLSAGWRSQDSLAASAMSGSMVDMHLALQREGHADPYAPRRSRLWATTELDAPDPEPVVEPPPDDKAKKKKKGLAKIWGIVTGKHGGGEAASRGPFQGQDKPEDDFPLAPPPPLSYLVNRGPGDMRAPNNRHVSTPPLQSLPSQKHISTTTPGANAFPSPPSSRLSAPDIENSHNIHSLDDKDIQYSDDTVGKSQTRNVHPVISEPNMRRHSPKISMNIPPVPAFPGSTPRPQPLSSRDKSLPPLPVDSGSRVLNHTSEARPRTVYTYDPRQRPLGAGPAHDFIPPSAPFRSADTRRQSFGGLSSRPNLQTMPSNLQQQPGYNFGAHYNEFGASRRSLGPLDQFKLSAPSPHSASTAKRKSKFGLASLLGKKSNVEQEDFDLNASHRFPSMKQPGFTGDEEMGASNYDTSNSRHSVFSARPSTQLSTNSRKALEERVTQDSQFVAYRYPSNDQRLDLLR